MQHPYPQPLFVDAQSRRLLSQLDRIAPSEASVLLVGETGTGKELVARQIHARSDRGGPFVAVNCGALSETLGEAALFGNEAGAYTGAHSARAGWFEAARGGTLFLDEIGDLPLTLQVALLRVLQEREVVRLGSRKSTPIDVRVIAATNIDVVRAVAEGKFRLDLYYRLSVVTLELPPLRERSDDVLPLAQHYAHLFAAKLGRSVPKFAPDAEYALLSYAWPGNVRELENVIHGAVLLGGATIHRSDLRLVSVVPTAAPCAQAPDRSPSAVSAGAQEGPPDRSPSAVSAGAQEGPPDRSPSAVRPGAQEGPPANVPASAVGVLAPDLERLFHDRPQQLLDSIESLVIRRALAFCGGNQVHTAKLLGISRNVLRTYLKRFGLIGRESREAVACDEAEPLSTLPSFPLRARTPALSTIQ